MDAWRTGHDGARSLTESFNPGTTMIMADVLKILLIILGVLIIYVSYWLLAEALARLWWNAPAANTPGR